MPKSRVNKKEGCDFSKDVWIVSLVNTGENNFVEKIFGHAVILVEGELDNGKEFIGEYDITAMDFPEEQDPLQGSIGNLMGYITNIRCNPKPKDRNNSAIHPVETYRDYESGNFSVSSWPVLPKKAKEMIEAIEADAKTLNDAKQHARGSALYLMENLPNENELEGEPFSIYYDNFIFIKTPPGIFCVRNGEVNVLKINKIHTGTFEKFMKEIRIINEFEPINEKLRDDQREAFNTLITNEGYVLKNAYHDVKWPFKYQKAGANRWSIWGGNGGHNCLTWAEEKLAIAGAGNGKLLTDSSKASTEIHIRCNII